jgi:hypothetical protein
MEDVVIVAIGAIPATLGAWAAVLAAKRSRVGNRDIRRMKTMLESHVTDGSLHYIDGRRNGAIRKEGRVS